VVIDRIEIGGFNIMNRTKWVIIAAVLGFLTFTADAQVGQVTVTGFITDTLSGIRGANALHADAAKRNVASGMASYALYDEKTKKLYILGQQDTAAANLGQRVTVAGTLAASPMSHAGQGIDAKSGQSVDFHHLGQDSSTPIAGVLTITSVALAPPISSRPNKTPQ